MRASPCIAPWLWAAKGAGVGRALNFLSFMGTALLPLRRVAEPDVIFVRSPPITLFMTALAYRRRFPRALLVFNIADQWIEVMRDFGVITNRRLLAGLTSYARFCYARADLLTAATSGLVDDLVLRHGVPATKVLLLPNGSATLTRLQTTPPPSGCWQRTTCTAASSPCASAPMAISTAWKRSSTPRAVSPICATWSCFWSATARKTRLIELARARGLDNVRFADPIPAAAVLPLYRRFCRPQHAA